MKRDDTFREKKQNKKISLAFSLSLSLQSFLVHTAFGRYESYLIIISFFFKRSAFTTKEEERRESFAYTVYIIASSSNRFPRFRKGEF